MQEKRWQSDDSAVSCTLCRVSFGLLTRRHHCRFCGQVFCSKCSDKTERGASGEKQRICDSCFLQKRGQTPSPMLDSAASSSSSSSKLVMRIQPASATQDELVYKTYSLCAKCSLIEKTGFDFHPAQVIERAGESIWLKQMCAVHGESSVLLCSNSSFFRRLMIYGGELKSTINASLEIVDIEDLTEKLRLLPPPSGSSSSAAAASPSVLPSVVDITLFRENFVSDKEIMNEIQHFVALFKQHSHNFMIKLNGGLVEKLQISELNDKINFLLEQKDVIDCPFLLDLSQERLLDLSELTNSALLCGRLYPVVRYFLSGGDELQCIEELKTLISKLSSISDISLVLLLNLEEPPYPNLSPLFDFIYTQTGIIRFVIASRQRAPSTIFDSLGANAPKTTEKKQQNVDPFPLVSTIEQYTGGKITHEDFIPLRIASIMEPILQQLGYGRYSIRASPFCLFGAILVNTSKLQGVSLTRLFDLERLYKKLSPIADKLKAQNKGVGLLTAREFSKALRKSLLPSAKAVVDLDEAFRLLESKSPKDQASLLKFIRGLQVILVHNNMDFASIDLKRRCNCAIVSQSPLNADGVAAACTGCI